MKKTSISEYLDFISDLLDKLVKNKFIYERMSLFPEPIDENEISLTLELSLINGVVFELLYFTKEEPEKIEKLILEKQKEYKEILDKHEDKFRILKENLTYSKILEFFKLNVKSIIDFLKLIIKENEIIYFSVEPKLVRKNGIPFPCILIFFHLENGIIFKCCFIYPPEFPELSAEEIVDQLIIKTKEIFEILSKEIKSKQKSFVIIPDEPSEDKIKKAIDLAKELFENKNQKSIGL